VDCYTTGLCNNNLRAELAYYSTWVNLASSKHVQVWKKPDSPKCCNRPILPLDCCYKVQSCNSPRLVANQKHVTPLNRNQINRITHFPIWRLPGMPHLKRRRNISV